MASAAVEVHQRKNESSLGSKSARPHVQIDSISIDIASSKKKETEKRCNHFSIRGFVDEVRKKNPKLCDPFSLYGLELNNSKDPHHETPLVEGGSHGTGKVFLDSNGGNKNTPSEKIRNAHLLGPMEGKMSVGGRNAEASTSFGLIFVSNDKNRGPKSSDRKGKAIAEEYTAIQGIQNGFKDKAIQGIQRTSTDGVDINGLASEEPIPKLKCNRIVESTHKDCVSVGFNHKDENLPGSQRTKKVSIENRPRKMLMNCEETEVAGLMDVCDNTEARPLPLPDLNESDKVSSKRGEALNIGKNAPFEEDDDYLGGSYGRKPRKVRFLSELLASKDYVANALLKNGNDSSIDYPGTSSKKGPLSLSPGQVQANGNVTSSLSSQKRKRKSSQDEGSRSMEIRDPNNSIKRVPILETETSETESEGSESVEIVSQVAIKRRLKAKPERNLQQGKIIKKLKVGLEGSTGPSQTAQTVEGERKFPSHKKKKKITRMEKAEPSRTLLNNHVPEESSATRKHLEVSQTSTSSTWVRPVQDAAAIKPMHHYPKNYLDVGNDSVRVSLVKDGLFSQSDNREHIPRDENVIRRQSEARNVAETSAVFRTPIDASFIARNVSQKSNLKGKQIWNPEAEVRGHAMEQQMGMQAPSGMRLKDTGADVPRRMWDIDINAVPIDDRVLEQGLSEDIPMDIVELMAKNQYERQHRDAPNDKRSAFVPHEHGKRALASAEVYGDRMFQLGHGHFPAQSPQMSNIRVNVAKGARDIGPSKQNFFGSFPEMHRNYFDARGYTREMQLPPRYGVPVPGQEQISSYTPRVFNPSNWVTNTEAQTLPTHFMGRSQSHPHRNIEARVLPSMVPNRMPPVLNTPPCSQGQSIFNFNAISFAKPNTGFSNAYNIGLAETSLASKQKGPNNPPKVMGPVDSYSNEAIPAMHLLSLMQNAAKMRPNVPFTVDGKPEFLKRSSLLSDHHNKHYSGSHNMASYKITGAGPRHPLHENNGRASLPGNSCPCYPSHPSTRPISPSYQNEVSVGRSGGYLTPIPLTLRGQRNMEGPRFMNGDNGCQKSVPCDPSRRRLVNHANDKGKGIVAPHEVLHTNEESMRENGMISRRVERNVGLEPENMMCSMNQNPAEFTDLKLVRKFTIGAEELKGKGYRKKPGRPRLDAKRGEKMINTIVEKAREMQNKP